ncbi:MAG: TPM domain-containing protein [Leptospiraceae bacterium]|nr:TPM domain-containing protein [Leptospiraceae bacterium]
MSNRRQSILSRWAALTGVAILTLIPVSRSFAEPDLQPLPTITSYVTDTTGTLNQSEKDDLSKILERIEEENGSQVVVVLIPTTQPEAVEQYSLRLASQVGIGRKATDDGVLILLAKDDRRIRIEVGYGLEGAIPDARANRIIEQTIVPELKKGNFYIGLRDAVLEIERLIKKEELPPPDRTVPETRTPDRGFDWMGLFYRAWYYWGWLAYVLGFVVAWIAGKRSEYSWGMLWTVAVAAHPPLLFFLLNGVFFPIYALPRILISLVLFHIGYWLSGGKFPKMASGSGGTSSGSGYSSSGRSWSSGSSSRSYSSSSSSYSSSSSRSSSSSSSSSRSYSGGGGSFGGGGASGSW